LAKKASRQTANNKGVIMCKKEIIIKGLETLALKGTIPFCRSCFKKALAGRCLQCGTDDLMRLHEGQAVSMGWIGILLTPYYTVDKIDYLNFCY